MKLKALAAPLILSVVCSVAQAQDFRFYFGYGDATTAALNGRQVGDEISASSPLLVAPGQKFKVQIWTEKLRGHIDAITAGISVHVAYDRAMAGNAGQIPASTLLHRKLAFGGTTMGNSISNHAMVALFDNYGLPIDGDSNGLQDIEPLGTASAQLRGVYAVGASTIRPVGFGGQHWRWASNTGEPAFWKMGAVGAKTRLYDFEMTNALLSGETYGTGPDDSGLWLTPKLSPNTTIAGTHSFVYSWEPPYTSADNRGATIGSRLIVQAVPEPSGIAALVLGVFAVFRPNRKPL